MKVLHEEKLLKYEIISMPVEENRKRFLLSTEYLKIACFVLEARI